MPDTHVQADPHAAVKLPLHGLVVLDLTLARAGPTCVRHLADWGADVIRIEPPESGGEEISGDRDGPDFQNLHRNKRMIQLNLKSSEGHAAFMRLARDADVIVENMRANVKHRLKIAWENVHAINPRLVYGSISGFGQTGPYSARAGVDQIAQGMGRVDEHHRPAGAGAGARGHPHCRPDRRQPAGVRDHDRAVRARAHRGRSLGPNPACWKCRRSCWISRRRGG